MTLIRMIFLLFVLLLGVLNAFYGQSYQTNNKTKPIHEVKAPSPTSVRHSKNSTLPDTIHIVGRIVELTPGYCGIFCFGGSLKVKLAIKIPNYNNQYAYIITACMSYEVKPGNSVDVIASKLTDKDRECYYLSNTATVNSKGFPFYKLSEAETSKIH